MGMVDEAPLGAEACHWMRAHEALSRLARQRAAADAEEGRWLLCALRAAAHVHLGHASFSQYIERIFGYSPRSTQEKLRVAEALEQLPRLARSLETGALSWCAARELTRVAVAATEHAWLDAAQGKTTREIEALVAGKNPGDEPSSKSSEQPRPRVLRFEVTPETFALFREAMHRLRRAAGGCLDDDAALLSMARQVLGGPGDAGRSSYQVSLTVCAACGSVGQQAGGELVPVGAEIVAMAECDAQHLGQILPRAANENASVSGPVSALHSEWDEPSSVHARVGAGLITTPRANSDAHHGLITPATAAHRALAQNKPSRQRCAGPYSRAISVAAACRAAPMRRSWTSITSCRAPRAGVTRLQTSSPCVDRTIGRCIAASSASSPAARLAFAFATPMARFTASPPPPTPSMCRPRSSRRCATSAFASETSARARRAAE
jgi:hypothetical protein